MGSSFQLTRSARLSLTHQNENEMGLDNVAGIRERTRAGDERFWILDFGLEEPKPGTSALDGEKIAVTGTAGCCSRNPCGVRAHDEYTKRTRIRTEDGG